MTPVVWRKAIEKQARNMWHFEPAIAQQKFFKLVEESSVASQKPGVSLNLSGSAFVGLVGLPPQPQAAAALP